MVCSTSVSINHYPSLLNTPAHHISNKNWLSDPGEKYESNIGKHRKIQAPTHLHTYPHILTWSHKNTLAIPPLPPSPITLISYPQTPIHFMYIYIKHARVCVNNSIRICPYADEQLWNLPGDQMENIWCRLHTQYRGYHLAPRTAPLCVTAQHQIVWSDIHYISLWQHCITENK